MTTHVDTRTSQLRIVSGVRRPAQVPSATASMDVVSAAASIPREGTAKREHRFGAAIGVVAGNIALWGLVSLTIGGVLLVQGLIAGTVLASFFGKG